MLKNLKAYIAECIGTFILVVIGCGVAVLSGADLVATSLAFGISIMILAYSVGKISGGHVNPAVSLAFLIKGDLKIKDFLFYVLAQVIGALLGSLLLGLFFKGYNATGANDVTAIAAIFSSDVTFGVLLVGFAVEVVLTFFFVLAILGVTSSEKTSNFAGIVIGLALTGVHLLGIRLTGTSVNPARSLSAAICSMFAGNYEPIKEIWIFILAPLVGAALAALLWKFIDGKKAEKAEEPKAE